MFKKTYGDYIRKMDNKELAKYVANYIVVCEKQLLGTLLDDFDWESHKNEIENILYTAYNKEVDALSFSISRICDNPLL